MNCFSIPQKTNNARMTAAAVLALCVVLSGAILFGRLMQFSAREACHYIPLTRSAGLTTVTREQTGLRFSPSPLLVASPGFQVTDRDTVWTGRTDVEIFRISYDNASGETTVRSRDGSKLLAPGTGGSYTFALKNTGNVTLAYTMDMQAYLGEHAIPVRARVIDGTGRFLAGSADEMAGVLELTGVSDGGDLRAGYVMPYTLEWEWPFEEDDAYDTMLGNLAVEQDIALTIVINTTAAYTPAPGGGFPQTGDTGDLAMLAMLTLASAAGLILMLSHPVRNREDGHE